MIRFFFISVFFYLPLPVVAQQEARKAIKLNLNSTIVKNVRSPFLISPSLSVRLNAHRKLLHEIEINRVSATNYIDSASFPYMIRFRNATLGLRHQVIYPFFRGKRVQPQIGLSINYNMQRSAIDPLDNGYGRRRIAMVRATIGFVPQVQWNLNGKFFLVLAAPIDFFDQIFYTQKVGAVRERGAFYQSYFLESYKFTLSLGMRVSKR